MLKNCAESKAAISGYTVHLDGAGDKAIVGFCFYETTEISPSSLSGYP
jgi:hypothetical protein